MMEQPLYHLRGIRRVYGDRTVLAIDELSIPDTGITGLFGPNGSGKSTLLALLALLTPPDAGSLLVRGQDSRALETEQRRQITILPQDPYLLNRSVAANVGYGLRVRGIRDNLDERIVTALEWVGLSGEFVTRKSHQLSGGEARRVALAARLVLQPRVLILDEPTSGVDAASTRMIRAAILRARQQWNTTLIIASHDRHWLEQVCDRRIHLFRGRLIPYSTINLLFGPWQRYEGKTQMSLPDGQRIVLPPPPGRETTVLLQADRLRLIPADQNAVALSGRVSGLRRPDTGDGLLVEAQIAGYLFEILADTEASRRFRPGDRIGLEIPDTAVTWL